MKRPAAILAVLIAMVAMIGIGRFVDQKGFRLLISDDRTPSSREIGPTTRADNTRSRSSRIEGLEPSRSTRAENRDPTTSIGTAQTNDDSGSQVVAVSVTGEISPIHFFRGSTVFETSEPTKEQIARLREAVDFVGDALQPSAVIFDADGSSTSQIPVMLFVRDAFDLTVQIKEIYDTLEHTAIHPAQAESKAADAATE